MKNQILLINLKLSLLVFLFTFGQSVYSQNLQFEKETIPNSNYGEVLFTKSNGDVVMVFTIANSKKIYEKTSSGLEEIVLTNEPFDYVYLISGPNNMKLLDINPSSGRMLFKYQENTGFTQIQTESPYRTISDYGQSNDRMILLYEGATDNKVYVACYNGQTFTDFELSTEYNSNFGYFNFNPSLNTAYFKAYSFTSNKWGFFAANFQGESTSTINLPSTTVGFNSLLSFSNGNTIVEITNNTITGDLKLLSNNQLLEINDIYTNLDYFFGINVNNTAFIFGYKIGTSIQSIYKIDGQTLTDVTPTGTIIGTEFMSSVTTSTSLIKVTKSDGMGSSIDELYKVTENGLTLISGTMQNSSQIRNFTPIKKVGDHVLIKANTDSEYYYYWISENGTTDVTSSGVLDYQQLDQLGTNNMVRIIVYDGFGGGNHKMQLYSLVQNQPLIDVTPTESMTGINFLTTNNNIDYYSGKDLSGKTYLISATGSNAGIITTTPGFVSYAFKKFSKLYFTNVKLDYSGLDKLFELNGNSLNVVHTFDNEDENYSNAGEENIIIYKSNLKYSLATLKYSQSILGEAFASISSNQYSLSNYTATSGLNITFTSSDTTLAKVNNLELVPQSMGVVTITAFQGGNSQYAKASLSILVTISGTQQTIVGIPSSLTLTVGGNNYALSNISVTSGLDLSFSSSDINFAKIENNEIVPISAGVVTITAIQSGNGLYQSASENFVVTILPKISQVLANIPSSSVITLSNIKISLQSITATSGLPVTIQSSNSAVIAVENDSLKTLSVGVTTITAIQNGAGVYEASPLYSWVVTVISPITNTETFEENIAINIYPNPTSELVYINGLEASTNISLLAANGQIAVEETINPNNAQINIGHLKNGIYTIVLHGKNGAVVKKIVKI